MRTTQAYMPPLDGSIGVRVVEIPDNSPYTLRKSVFWDRVEAAGKLDDALDAIDALSRADKQRWNDMPALELPSDLVSGIVVAIGLNPETILAPEGA
jgi:hypothetical protein